MAAVDSWDDLRYFLAVAREGTLAAAARTLGVNQSTVLRRVAHLEDNLGSRLFDRQPRGYSLTSVGEGIVPLAAQLEDDVLAFERTVAGADGELRGIIRITTVDEIMERIAPHLKCFRDRNPGVVLDVNTELRMFSLSRREADVAIRPGRPPTEADIVGRKLVALAFAAYASTDYLADCRRPRRPADLADHYMIDFGSDRNMSIIGDWLAELAPRANTVYRANSMVGQQLAAEAGLGVAILPCFMGDQNPKLERLFKVGEDKDHNLWLLFHADLRQNVRVRTFIDFITDAVSREKRLYEGKSRKAGA